MKKTTKAIHHPYHRRDVYDALSMLVYHALAFEFDNAEVMADAFCSRIDAPDYSRVENPTVTHFEERVQSLTEAKSVTAFNSGMAAISNALLALSQSGKKIVTSRHLFGNTLSFLTDTLSRFGVTSHFVDVTNLSEVEKALDDTACCLFLEIVSNPQVEVADLSALSRITRKAGVPMVVDTTMIPFTCFSAKELGIDVELVSSTKYVSGGATSLGGLVIDHGTVPGFTERIKNEMLFNLGAYMTPHAAYMQTLGLETLQVRYERQAATALTLARRLQNTSGVVKVNYPGLPDSPFHEVAMRQFGPEAGAMLTIDLQDKAVCFRFLDSLKLIHRATNLFDNRSLAIHPASTIFGLLSDEQCAEIDVFDTTIRLSIGLEDADDLYADLLQAIEQATKKQ